MPNSKGYSLIIILIGLSLLLLIIGSFSSRFLNISRSNPNSSAKQFDYSAVQLIRDRLPLSWPVSEPVPKPSPTGEISISEFETQRLSAYDLLKNRPVVSPVPSPTLIYQASPTPSPSQTSTPTPTQNPNSLAALPNLYLSPGSGTFNRGCEVNLDVYVNSNLPVLGIDVVLLLDTDKFSIVNSDDMYNGNGFLSFYDVDFSSGGTRKLRTLQFKISNGANLGQTEIKFKYDPNNPFDTNDSNVIVPMGTENIIDGLRSVTNGKYTIGGGGC